MLLSEPLASLIKSYQKSQRMSGSFYLITECHFCVSFFTSHSFINALPNDKILVWSKLKVFAVNKVDVNEQFKFFRKGRKYCGNRRNAD